MNFTFLIRTFFYTIIWFSYLLFMSSKSPLGINWLSFHSQRIFNSVQFYKLNGYLSTFGYSINSKCNGCNLNLEETMKIFKILKFRTIL